MNHFSRAAPEKIPYAIERFKKETLRVYGVLEIRLSGIYGPGKKPRQWLAGKGDGKYSVADIKAWSWVKVSFEPCFLLLGQLIYGTLETDKYMCTGMGANGIHEGRHAALPTSAEVDRSYS